MKTITITEKTWKKLWEIKFKNGNKNIDEVINLLIKEDKRNGTIRQRG